MIDSLDTIKYCIILKLCEIFRSPFYKLIHEFWFPREPSNQDKGTINDNQFIHSCIIKICVTNGLDRIHSVCSRAYKIKTDQQGKESTPVQDL